MSYYAEISGGVVVRVIVVDDAIDAGKWLASNLGGSWVECRKTGFKKLFPAKDYSYDVAKEEFVTKKPFPSWALDSKNNWQPPKKKPVDGDKDSWNETTQEWDAKE